MKLTHGKAVVLGTAMMLSAVQVGWTQQQAAPADKAGAQAAQAPESDPNSITVDVVGRLFSEDQSNLQGYWPALEKRTQDTWQGLMPAQTQPPQSVPGTVRILCVVHTDGSVSNMQLEQRSGKTPLDRAAWAAITRSAPYDAFPSGISTDRVKVRFTFLYNGGSAVTPLVKGVRRKSGL
ncbi:MAG TPA: energy transducer TonB [Acidobacteriaceae bacterium]|nr:energy transducer TonB [Acidobacteriaceae bacterium]